MSSSKLVSERAFISFCLCRSLSSKMFGSYEGLQPLFSFLHTLQIKGRPLMLNKRLKSCQQMEDALSLAVEYLSSASEEVSIQELCNNLRQNGGLGCKCAPIIIHNEIAQRPHVDIQALAAAKSRGPGRCRRTRELMPWG